MALLSSKLKQTGLLKQSEALSVDREGHKTNLYCLIKWNVCEQGTDVKRAHYLIVMFIHLGPVSKAERILDSGLICGDGLKLNLKNLHGIQRSLERIV